MPTVRKPNAGTKAKAATEKAAEAEEKQVTESVKDVIDTNEATVEVQQVPEAATQEQVKEQKPAVVPVKPEESEVVVEVAKKGLKLMRVKFLKDHDFNIGVEKIRAKKDDIKMVEPHIANKLLSRQIAYILG